MTLELKATILQRARELGFLAGIAPADALPSRAAFETFLARGYHADMAWLTRRPGERFDPRALLAGAKSVICLAAPYGPGACSMGVSPMCVAGVSPVEVSAAGGMGRSAAETATAEGGCATNACAEGGCATNDIAFALYARGRDYHRLLKKRCGQLLDAIRQLAPAMAAKICVDTAAINERSLAARAGLGWIGRNGCLITRPYGSFIFLAEIVTDLDLPCDQPARSRCGRCRRCLDACPTGALQPDGLIDCRRCISYLTIEHRGKIDLVSQPSEAVSAQAGEPVPPNALAKRIGGRIFGCDACQLACPWNRRHARGWEEFATPRHAALPSPQEILRWRPEDWDAFTRGSAMRRATYEMFLRNAAIAADSL